MIIYSVTVSIDPAVAPQWLAWMKDTHIPEVMATGCFTGVRMARILHEEEGGTTYNMQYLATTLENYMDYQQNFAPGLQAKTKALYDGRYAAFRTLLEEEVL